jgi:Protein of unknown function (DUF3618)
MSTTTNDPDEIRDQIDETRGQLSDDVNALAENTRPSTMARHGMSRVRENVMSRVPDKFRAHQQGNPLVLGGVAFGIGWLLGSLVRANGNEREASRS